jgi:hypothetical protein
MQQQSICGLWIFCKHFGHLQFVCGKSLLHTTFMMKETLYPVPLQVGAKYLYLVADCEEPLLLTPCHD